MSSDDIVVFLANEQAEQITTPTGKAAQKKRADSKKEREDREAKEKERQELEDLIKKTAEMSKTKRKGNKDKDNMI